MNQLDACVLISQLIQMVALKSTQALFSLSNISLAFAL
jgi:hypothetical protein